MDGKLRQEDHISKVEAILQYDFGLSFTEVRNMSLNELAREYAKFKWISKRESNIQKKLSNK